jgi:hypothetical protein
VFEKRVLRRTFGPKRDETIGGWRKLHNEELHSLYSSPSIIRMINRRNMRWVGHGARMTARMNACKVLVGKPERKRPLERPRHRSVHSIDLAQYTDQWRAVVNKAMNL